jgi:hypothetical protein
MPSALESSLENPSKLLLDLESPSSSICIDAGQTSTGRDSGRLPRIQFLSLELIIKCPFTFTFELQFLQLSMVL